MLIGICWNVTVDFFGVDLYLQNSSCTRRSKVVHVGLLLYTKVQNYSCRLVVAHGGVEFYL